jgi:predicted  nucleic acid-binding Zn-ribbon protein
MEPIENLADLHREHADWQNRIAQLKNDIKDMSDRLGTIVSKLTPRDVPANVEHFQNQFIVQRNVLDIMRHDFKQYENMIEAEQKDNKKASEDLVKTRDAYRVRLSDFEQILNELKAEFATFQKEEVISA